MESGEQLDRRRRGPLWEALQRESQDDPELARKLEMIERIMEENKEVLQRLAQS